MKSVWDAKGLRESRHRRLPTLVENTLKMLSKKEQKTVKFINLLCFRPKVDPSGHFRCIRKRPNGFLIIKVFIIYIQIS